MIRHIGASDGRAKASDHGRFGMEWRTVFFACAIYCSVILLFTVISLYTAPKASQVGTFRPAATIPSHEAILALFGLGLGLAASLFLRKLDLSLVILAPALVLLTDLDHFPSYFDVAQPIRPAHSFIFILSAVALMAMVIRRTDVELISLSAFFAHLAVDTGVFPPLSPISFSYYDIGSFRIPFLVAAVSFAVAAGFVLRRGKLGDLT